MTRSCSVAGVLVAENEVKAGCGGDGSRLESTAGASLLAADLPGWVGASSSCNWDLPLVGLSIGLCLLVQYSRRSQHIYLQASHH